MAGTAIINAIGVLGTALGVFSFAENEYNKPNGDIFISLKIGLNGARGPLMKEPLADAGGDKPRVFVYDNQGKLLGRSRTQDIRDEKCQSGDDNCVVRVRHTGSVLEPIRGQPSYALLQGNNDAVCIAAASVTYPGGDKYGWVGNWAKECGAAWYYSDIDAKTSSGSQKLTCAWVDKDGHVSTTGIQIHWPEFSEGFTGNGNDPKYYCQDKPALRFFTHPTPRNITYWTGDGSQVAETPYFTAPIFDNRRHIDPLDSEDVTRRTTKRTPANDTRLVRSKHAGHSAKELCNSKTSVGPSFVSQEERAFCYMPEKKLFQLCDDVQSGGCWDDKEGKLSMKGPKEHARSLDSVPDVTFDTVITWGDN